MLGPAQGKEMLTHTFCAVSGFVCTYCIRYSLRVCVCFICVFLVTHMHVGKVLDLIKEPVSQFWNPCSTCYVLFTLVLCPVSEKVGRVPVLGGFTPGLHLLLCVLAICYCAFKEHSFFFDSMSKPQARFFSKGKAGVPKNFNFFLKTLRISLSISLSSIHTHKHTHMHTSA